jgi:hypothetical protein
MEELLRNLCGDEIDALLDVRAMLAGALAIMDDQDKAAVAHLVAASEPLQYVLRLLRQVDKAVTESIERHDEASAAAHRLARGNVVNFSPAPEGQEAGRDSPED